MLTPDKIRYECGVKICEKIIPDTARATKNVAPWVRKGDLVKPNRLMSPIGITIHNTSDLRNVNDDAEQYTRATWPNCNMAGTVVHYYVDDQGAWQNLRENETGWHASDGSGNGNRKTIAIECIMDGSESEEDIKAKDNAARLIASIMKRYNWTLNNLYTHNRWMGLPDEIVKGASKNCPLYLLPKYTEFRELIQQYLDAIQEIRVGSIVGVKDGAVYGGLSSSRGLKVPQYVCKKQLTVSKIQINKNVQEALLKEINSWVAVNKLNLIK